MQSATFFKDLINLHKKISKFHPTYKHFTDYYFISVFTELLLDKMLLTHKVAHAHKAQLCCLDRQFTGFDCYDAPDCCNHLPSPKMLHKPRKGSHCYRLLHAHSIQKMRLDMPFTALQVAASASDTQKKYSLGRQAAH